MCDGHYGKMSKQHLNNNVQQQQSSTMLGVEVGDDEVSNNGNPTQWQNIEVCDRKASR